MEMSAIWRPPPMSGHKHRRSSHGPLSQCSISQSNEMMNITDGRSSRWSPSLSQFTILFLLLSRTNHCCEDRILSVPLSQRIFNSRDLDTMVNQIIFIWLSSFVQLVAANMSKEEFLKI